MPSIIHGIDPTKCERGKLLYRGSTNQLYAVRDHPELLIIRHLDKVTRDNSTKSISIPGKGVLVNQISNTLLELLNGKHTNPENRHTPIKTHFFAPFSETEVLVWRVEEPMPLEVIIRNRADGSFSRKYGVPVGQALARPICEFTLKNDQLKDPLMNDDQILALELAHRCELDHMREVALAANRIMQEFFLEINIELIDFKLDFGRLTKSARGDYTNLRIIGEISPDTCRLIDRSSGKYLDKEIFRQGLPGLAEAYETVSQKISERSRELANRHMLLNYYDGDGRPMK